MSGRWPTEQVGSIVMPAGGSTSIDPREIDREFAYGLVLENAIVGVSYMRGRRFIWANRRMSEIFGYEVDELAGQSVRILYADQNDYEEVGRMYAQFARNNRYSHERAMVRKDGELIWCLIAGRMIEPIGPESPSVWVVQDISDKKRTEDELRRSKQRLELRVEQRTVNLRRRNETLRLEIERRRLAQIALVESREKYRTLFRTIPLGVLVTSAQGEVVEVNHNLRDYIGATTIRQLDTILDDETRVIEGTSTTSMREFARRQSAAVQRRILRLDVGWLSSDGKLRDLAVAIAATSGHEFGATFAFSDVTVQRLTREREHEQQQALTHASRLSLVGQMASALAHELGQPLNACQSYVEGLKHRLANELSTRPEESNALSRISDHLDQAGRIIRQVRAFVSRHQPDCQEIEPADLIQQTLSLLAVPLRASTVVVTVDVMPKAPRIAVNIVEIQQVLVNLFMNAIDAFHGAATQERHIGVKVWREGRRQLNVQVRDNGPGVADDHRRRLFEPYFTTKSAGLGMGLMICRNIVECHGGEIGLIDDDVPGACFRFTLPVAKAS